jgi:hypothetical protein
VVELQPLALVVLWFQLADMKPVGSNTMYLTHTTRWGLRTQPRVYINSRTRTNVFDDFEFDGVQ